MYPSIHDIQVSNYPSIQKKLVSKISKYPDIKKKWYPSIPSLDIFIQKSYGKIAIAQMIISPFARFYASPCDEF